MKKRKNEKTKKRNRQLQGLENTKKRKNAFAALLLATLSIIRRIIKHLRTPNRNLLAAALREIKVNRWSSERSVRASSQEKSEKRKVMMESALHYSLFTLAKLISRDRGRPKVNSPKGTALSITGYGA